MKNFQTDLQNVVFPRLCAIQVINRNKWRFFLAAKLTLRRHLASKAAYKVFRNAFPYHRTAEARRECQRPCLRARLKSGHPGQVAQDHVQMDLVCLQGQTTHQWISLSVDRLSVIPIIQLTESKMKVKLGRVCSNNTTRHSAEIVFR